MGSCKPADTSYSLAELTTVVLCGSMVILPKFVQVIRRKSVKSSSAYSEGPDRVARSHPKFSRTFMSNRSAPWADTDDTLQSKPGTYIPLEEGLALNHARKDDPDISDHNEPPSRGITKTVKIETDI